jgi:hypothetical protein
MDSFQLRLKSRSVGKKRVSQVNKSGKAMHSTPPSSQVYQTGWLKELLLLVVQY